MPPDLWRLLTADPSEMQTRSSERARDWDQIKRSIERLVAGQRLSANALHDLGSMVEAGTRIILPAGASLITSVVKGAPWIAPNIRYRIDDALVLTALAVLVLAADPDARGSLGRCKECGGLFQRPAAPRGHRRREFCPGTRCAARHHERNYRSCRIRT